MSRRVRLYLDVGSHPEYATAECDSLVQLINHDRAGELVLEDLLVDAEQRLVMPLAQLDQEVIRALQPGTCGN